MSEKKEPKKVIDVSHPGDSAPSETSKPVIVTNRPILQDPMVVQDEQAGKEVAKDESEGEVHKVEVKKTGIKLTTVSEAEVLKEEIKTTEEAKEPETEPVSQPEAAPEKKEAPGEKSSEPEDEVDELKDADAEENKEAEALKRDEELQKLADSKKYYLPINSLEKRRTHRVVVFGLLLSLLLGAAWLNIALDAGLINLGGVKAVTNFF